MENQESQENEEFAIVVDVKFGGHVSA